VALALAGAQARIAYQRTELAGRPQRVGDQTQLIEGFRVTASTVRNELAAWKAMHANMWEALGPELGGGSKASGVGGIRTAAEDEEKVAAGPHDELALLLESVTEEGPRIRELERLIGRTGEVVSSLPLRWPVRGRVNSEYGKRVSPWGGAAEHHAGLDISTPLGTPVMCPAPGKVLLAGGGGDYGRHVVIQHANGVRSLYGHLSKVEVKAGQQVEKGQLLGRTGSTGRSTGPHLHYELRVAGKTVNPRVFLWEGKNIGPLPEATASR
jgi:murein DD-endopeptidase MepM/ murein hydrolase activator NlpD